MPELPTVDKNDKCEPILRLIFNEEDVQAIISVSMREENDL